MTLVKIRPEMTLKLNSDTPTQENEALVMDQLLSHRTNLTLSSIRLDLLE